MREGTKVKAIELRLVSNVGETPIYTLRNRHKKSKRKMLTKTCPQCKLDFTTPDKRQKYCSRKCAGEYFKKYAVCENCGKRFWTSKRKCPTSKRRFCSRACSFEFREKDFETWAGRKKKERPIPIIYKPVCPICGNEFETKRANQKYCGKRDCILAVYRKQETKRRYAKYQYGFKVFNCIQCGREFSKFINLDTNTRRYLYCSDHCCRKAENSADRETGGGLFSLKTEGSLDRRCNSFAKIDKKWNFG